jgi:hypothetical protein
MTTGRRSGHWPVVLSTGVGIAVAIVLLAYTALLASTAPPPLKWSGPSVYNDVGPREFGSGGPIGQTNCTNLHVRFNASGPIDMWIAPGGSFTYSAQNGTLEFTQYWAFTGPASMGSLVVHIPRSSTGYRTVLFNPSLTVTIPSMQFEFATVGC